MVKRLISGINHYIVARERRNYVKHTNRNVECSIHNSSC
nr:MAG TPA: hypothetical protein [Crassvirales sp.]